FPAGSAPEFRLTKDLSDGEYTYELRLTPIISSSVKEDLKAAREKGNSDAVFRDYKKRGLIPTASVQSGSFAVLNGSIVVAGASEGRRIARASGTQPRPAPVTVQSAAPVA